MGFVKVPDNLPHPKLYLEAGLPRPNDSLPGRHSVVADGVEHDPGASRAGANNPLISRTTVGPDGNLRESTWFASQRHLAYPQAIRFNISQTGAIVSTEFDQAGFLHVTRGAPETRSKGAGDPAPRSGAVDIATARIVTIDLSVALADIVPTWFRPDDAICISCAIALELAVVTYSRENPGGETGTGRNLDAWYLTAPVPVDFVILRILQQIVLNLRPTYLAETGLTRTDLLCAATAIAYDIPMYTTKPEAYKPIRNGLKVIRYGPPKKGAKTAAAGRASKPAAAMTPAANLLQRFRHGQPWDYPAQLLLDAATKQPKELGATVESILGDNDSDPTWRTALLERAPALRDALSDPEVDHAGLMFALWNATNPGAVDSEDPALQREARAAIAALALWGRWPEDASEDVLGDLERGMDDVLWLYPVYLAWVGTPPAAIAGEMRSIKKGTATPSRARIEELRAQYGTGAAGADPA